MVSRREAWNAARHPACEKRNCGWYGEESGWVGDSLPVELLPQEFKEAVLAKEALPGMDEDTVILALGRPNRKTTEIVNGVEQEQWQYDGRGLKKKFIVFENNVVVKIVEY